MVIVHVVKQMPPFISKIPKEMILAPNLVCTADSYSFNKEIMLSIHHQSNIARQVALYGMYGVKPCVF